MGQNDVINYLLVLDVGAILGKEVISGKKKEEEN